MKIVCPLLVMALLPATAVAQCAGMSLTLDPQPGCLGGTIYLTITGGNPPYTVELFSLPQSLVTLFLTSSTSLAIPADAATWANTSGAKVYVTDANNFLCSIEAPGPTYRYLQGVVQPSALDCATGSFKARMSFTSMAIPPTFSADNGPVQSTTGTWTNSAGAWSLNAVLAPGAHTITFPQSSSGGWTVCASSWNVTIPAPISPGDCGVNLRVRAALDGALPSGTTMTDGLRAAGLVPTSEPYSALGYTYVGSSAGVSISASLLTVTGNDAIVDWVVVELRSTTTTVAWSKPALLQRDGDVIDTDGNGYLNFPLAVGSYHVALRQRNHLGVMTASPGAMGADPAQAGNLVDLRLTTTNTYGTNARVLKGSVQCLWAGDATGNGTVKYTGAGNDRDPILTAVGSTTPNNVLLNQYSRLDANLDGSVKYTGAANDRDIILTNVGSTTPNNSRTQQLP